ncbi:MAG TPA: hypothetical protein VFV58_07030 [Blastocatellia bacterium]|jgi:hypothetical protein|nr:hypothetical protein [Blastocatellia bacterium]
MTTLLEEKQKLNEKCKELKAKVTHLRFGIVICVFIGLALWGYVIHLRSVYGSLQISPNRPIAQLDQTQLGPDEYLVAKVFSVEGQPGDVNIGVSAECQNCDDKALAMLLLNDSNYQRFERRLNYEPSYEVIDIKKFGFDGNLEKGHYYIVFHNTSINRSVLVKIDVDVRSK